MADGRKCGASFLIIFFHSENGNEMKEPSLENNGRSALIKFASKVMGLDVNVIKKSPTDGSFRTPSSFLCRTHSISWERS